MTEKNNNVINYKEFMIFAYRNGLVDKKFHTLEETGQEFGVTRERIRQIEAKTKEKIRFYFKLPYQK